MQAKVQRWGNSLALRLPKATAEQLGLAEGSSVELHARGARLVITPTHRYDLGDLLSRIKPQSLHGEVSSGESRGKEAW